MVGRRGLNRFISKLAWLNVAHARVKYAVGFADAWTPTRMSLRQRALKTRIWAVVQSSTNGVTSAWLALTAEHSMLVTTALCQLGTQRFQNPDTCRRSEDRVLPVVTNTGMIPEDAASTRCLSMIPELGRGSDEIMHEWQNQKLAAQTCRVALPFGPKIHTVCGTLAKALAVS